MRYLRAHSEELGLDPNCMVAMGESAGGYMASLLGLTANRTEWDRGDNRQESAAVNGVCAFYPVTQPTRFGVEEGTVSLHADAVNYPDLPQLITPSAPPFLILQGDSDTQVPMRHSRVFYDTLQQNGVRSELHLFHGADHSDAVFFEDSTKQLILDFINTL